MQPSYISGSCFGLSKHPVEIPFPTRQPSVFRDAADYYQKATSYPTLFRFPLAFNHPPFPDLLSKYLWMIGMSIHQILNFKIPPEHEDSFASLTRLCDDQKLLNQRDGHETRDLCDGLSDPSTLLCVFTKWIPSLSLGLT
jgi:hypothetical protein